jgi:hypothetical protein
MMHINRPLLYMQYAYNLIVDLEGSVDEEVYD